MFDLTKGICPLCPYTVHASACVLYSLYSYKLIELGSSYSKRKYYCQNTKILLPKYEIIMVQSNHSNF